MFLLYMETDVACVSCVLWVCSSLQILQFSVELLMTTFMNQHSIPNSIVAVIDINMMHLQGSPAFVTQGLLAKISSQMF